MARVFSCERFAKLLDAITFFDMAEKSVFEFTTKEVTFTNNFIVEWIILEFYRIPDSSFQLFADKLDSSLKTDRVY